MCTVQSPPVCFIRVIAGTLALAAVALAAAGARAAHGQPAENGSEKLAKTLRRQLMKDNYDYMSTESDEPLAPGHNEDRKPQSNEDTGSDDRRGETDNINEKDKRNDDVDQIYDQSRARDIASDEDIKRMVRARIVQKLARRVKARGYVEEFEEDIARRHLQGFGASAPGEENSTTERTVDQSTTVTYKILKLRSPYRRSGDATLIQEEAADHVALVSLGGPVPPLPLPGPRQQYMRGPRLPEGLDEGELSPPDVGDDERRSEGLDKADNEERTSKPFRKRLEADAGEGNALRMTITPDGIFVL